MKTRFLKARIRFFNAARLVLSAAICALPGLGGLAGAAEPGPPREIDGRADQWLKRMGAYLAEAKSFSVSAEVWQDVELSSGQHAQAGRNLSFQLRRPDRLRVEVRSTRRNRELLFDGNMPRALSHISTLIFPLWPLWQYLRQLLQRPIRPRSGSADHSCQERGSWRASEPPSRCWGEVPIAHSAGAMSLHGGGL